MTSPTSQTLPQSISMLYSYWDGTNLLNALPIKLTPNSQVADFVVWDQSGVESVKTNVRHQSSGDLNYWYVGNYVRTAAPAPTPPVAPGTNG